MVAADPDNKVATFFEIVGYDKNDDPILRNKRTRKLEAIDTTPIT